MAWKIYHWRAGRFQMIRFFVLFFSLIVSPNKCFMLDDAFTHRKSPYSSHWCWWYSAMGLPLSMLLPLRIWEVRWKYFSKGNPVKNISFCVELPFISSLRGFHVKKILNWRCSFLIQKLEVFFKWNLVSVQNTVVK